MQYLGADGLESPHRFSVQHCAPTVVWLLFWMSPRSEQVAKQKMVPGKYQGAPLQQEAV